jgi:hypothetical protein
VLDTAGNVAGAVGRGIKEYAPLVLGELAAAGVGLPPGIVTAIKGYRLYKAINAKKAAAEEAPSAKAAPEEAAAPREPQSPTGPKVQGEKPFVSPWERPAEPAKSPLDELNATDTANVTGARSRQDIRDRVQTYVEAMPLIRALAKMEQRKQPRDLVPQETPYEPSGAALAPDVVNAGAPDAQRALPPPGGPIQQGMERRLALPKPDVIQQGMEQRLALPKPDWPGAGAIEDVTPPAPPVSNEMTAAARDALFARAKPSMQARRVRAGEDALDEARRAIAAVQARRKAQSSMAMQPAAEQPAPMPPVPAPTPAPAPMPQQPGLQALLQQSLAAERAKKLAPAPSPAPPARPVQGDGLDIPEFLRRPMPGRATPPEGVSMKRAAEILKQVEAEKPAAPVNTPKAAEMPTPEAAAPTVDAIAPSPHYGKTLDDTTASAIKDFLRKNGVSEDGAKPDWMGKAIGTIQRIIGEKYDTAKALAKDIPSFNMDDFLARYVHSRSHAGGGLLRDWLKAQYPDYAPAIDKHLSENAFSSVYKHKSSAKDGTSKRKR